MLKNKSPSSLKNAPVTSAPVGTVARRVSTPSVVPSVPAVPSTPSTPSVPSTPSTPSTPSLPSSIQPVRPSTTAYATADSFSFEFAKRDIRVSICVLVKLNLSIRFEFLCT